MPKWNFIPDHPISLTIAADARISPIDYSNDQIWELKLGNSDSPFISLETTFGLRARICRLFPRFIYKDQVYDDPAKFSHPISVHRYYPNFIELSFKPFSNINVKLEYWVPGSQVIAGRITIKNISHETSPIQVEMNDMLVPSEDGVRMAETRISTTTILAGKTANIEPVLFFTGGAQAGKSAYPSLTWSYNIPSHEEKVIQWAHASLSDINSSYELTKSVINQNWEAEFARIRRLNSRDLAIYTGNKDWDNAFLFSQTLAYQLIINRTEFSKCISTVSTRNPDQGFSMLGDGTDYNHLWNGQTPLELQYLLNFLLPSSPETVSSMLDKFLETQDSSGEIDLKPGLGGQRSHLLATPVLTNIALSLYEIDENCENLRSRFQKLYSFFLAWYSTLHDRDSDQVPEWDHVTQTGNDDQPLFSHNHEGSSGIDITTVENPELCSYLYRECSSLRTIAQLLNENEASTHLDGHLINIKNALDEFWSDEVACYHHRDRDTHLSIPGELLGTAQGSGVMEIHRDFQPPVRLIIYLQSIKEGTKPGKIYIHGTGVTGAHRVELIPSGKIRWQSGNGFATTEYAYQTIERIEFNGIRPDDSIIVRTVDLTLLDESLLLPLWAKVPSSDKAKILINLTIMNKKKFLSPHGLRSHVEILDLNNKQDEEVGCNLPLTAMVLEGLVEYGERKKAAEIFTRLMKPIVHTIYSDLALYPSYGSKTGKTQGAKNTITSLVPIGLFMNILGIKILNQYKVEISGNNPFPWPVTIKYHGLTVIKHEKKTFIAFPDGQNLTIENEGKHLISM